MPPSKKKKNKQRKVAAAAAKQAEDTVPNICDGCGLPGDKLLCCNRCKNAWYHNEKCQRDHFPTHKRKCKKAAVDGQDDKEKEVQRVCDCCGLPARSPDEKLLCCAACDSAWYHDKICQVKHYTVHKKDCRELKEKKAKRDQALIPMEADGLTMSELLATLTESDDEDYYDDEDELPPFVKCEVREGRGRCIVAADDLDKGCNPLSSYECIDPKCGGDHGWCEPLVPPVLDTKWRLSCCCLCFKLAGANFAPPEEGGPTQKTLECITQMWCGGCQDSDPNRECESRAHVQYLKLHDKPPPPEVILMSRVIRYAGLFPQVARDFNNLPVNTQSMSEEDKRLNLMELFLVHEFLDCMGAGATKGVSSKWLERFYEVDYEDELDMFEEDIKWASRFSQNVLPVQSNLCKGIGIFPQASLFNHSCAPNTETTVFLRPNNFPAIQFMTNDAVSAGAELTLNYLSRRFGDTSTTVKRQEALWDKYRFICKCSVCLDFEKDDILTGFVCPTRGCNGKVRSHLAKDDSSKETILPSTDRYYQCSECGHDNFSKQSRWQDAIIGKTASLIDGRSLKAVKDGLFKSFELARNSFHNQSWIVGATAVEFVHFCAIQYEHERNDCEATDAEKEKRLRQIIEVIDHSRGALDLCMRGSVFDKNCLRLWGAQARLHISSHDTEALDDANDARSELNSFLPGSSQFWWHPFELGSICFPKSLCNCKECVDKQKDLVEK